MTYRLPALLCSALVLASGPAAMAASGEHIGEAIEVVNLVTADYSRDVRTLQRGDNVRQDEKISVGSDGRSELQFADKTKIALGPGSELMLDKFVYDPDKNNGSIILDFVEGTLRFITGVAEKKTYVIRTPSASITVRGTIFDLHSVANGPTYVLLHEGGVRACNDRGTCRDHDKPGRLMKITETGEISEPEKWANLDDKSALTFANAFPFVFAAPLIDPNPIFSMDDIILGNIPGDDVKPTPKKTNKKNKTYKKKSKPTKKATKKKKTYPKKKVTKKVYKKEKTKKRASNDAGKAILGAAAAGLAIYAITKGRKKKGGGGGGGGCRYNKHC